MSIEGKKLKIKADGQTQCAKLRNGYSIKLKEANTYDQND